MAKVFLSGQMEEYMKEIIFKIKNMDLAEYNGQMAKFIKVNGNKECNMVKESIKVEMESGDKDIGKMDKGFDDYAYFLILNFKCNLVLCKLICSQ